MPYVYHAPAYIAEAAALYRDGWGTRALAAKYGCAPSGMWGHLKKAGVKIRPAKKYTFDQAYFDHIDSEPKAYFLGLLYADRCNNYRLGNIEISLIAQDRPILESLKSHIGYDGPIATRRPKYEGCQEMCRLTLCGKRLSASLAAAGCVPRKSKSLAFPHWIRPDLKRHFVRGYFDGDGSVYIHDRSPHTAQASVGIVSTKSFCDDVRAEFARSMMLNGRVSKSPLCDMWYLAYCGNISAHAIRNYFYTDATVFGERKRKAFDAIPLPQRLRVAPVAV